MAKSRIRRTKNAVKEPKNILPEYQVELVLNGVAHTTGGATLYEALMNLHPDVMKNTNKGTLIMRHGEKTLERLIFARQVKRLFGRNDVARRTLVKIYEQSL